ncbi:CdaR family protein [Lacticaseibacillus sp. N501-2]|uniref:CdaR family protein n=1 Tax=Lacticaseibacillus salsurae TaxID=3367729 RepID=UPI0038B2B464
MNDFWESKWAYRLLAFLLAVGLFAYVNVQNINNTRQDAATGNSITATAKRTVSVPLQLNADSDKYFITGYPQKVKVTIEGAASLVTVTANTQNFRIIANLQNLGVGTHQVRLTESGLNKDLTYKIKPAMITVKIQDRKTRRMPIQVHYNKDSLAPGYTVGEERLSADTAEITGAKGEINRVYQVVANVVMKRNTKASVSQEVILQALDEDGNTVNVVVSPETVHVTLPISIPSKSVPLTLKPTGSAPDGKAVTVTSTTDHVTIYGASSVLKGIDSLNVPVNISGIASNQTKTLTLANLFPKLTDFSPQSIKVQYEVSDITSKNSSSQASSSSAKSSSNSSASSSSSSDASRDSSSAND